MFKISSELEKSRFELNRAKTQNSANYIFITDLHADSKLISSPEEAYELALKTLEYAVEFANNNDVDFVALGGDNVDSYGTKEHYMKCANDIVSILKKCKKPVIMVRGNHDNNHNRKQPVQEQISVEEWQEIWQQPFMNDGFIYDRNVKNGTYFYYDIPGKKTRVICFDSNSNVSFTENQGDWLLNEVFNVPDKGCKYIFLSHKAVKEEYKSEEDKNFSCANAEIIDGVARALVNKTEFRNKNFKDYKSKLVCVNFGHSHAGFLHFCQDYGCVMANTNGCGFCWPGQHKRFGATRIWDRKGKSFEDATKYLFDLFVVTDKKVEKIRIGQGNNSVIEL